MILASSTRQEIFNQSPFKLKNNFRATSNSFNKRYALQPKTVLSSPPRQYSPDQLASPEDVSCTNFMKNYVLKMKRQHKREKKKVLHNSIRHKQKTQMISIDALPIVKGNHDFISFQKITPGSFKRKIPPQIPSSSSVQNQQLIQLAKQIEIYKNRLKSQRQKQCARQKQRLRMGLPELRTSHKARLTKIKNDEVQPWERQSKVWLQDYQ